MKKFMSIILAVALLLTMAACGVTVLIPNS